MGPLQEIPLESWCPKLRDKMKAIWPQNMMAYYMLDMVYNFPKIREVMNIKIYCPYGDMDNGLVLISHNNEAGSSCRYCIKIFASSQDINRLNKLKTALMETKVNDWSKRMTLDFVPSYLIDCANTLLNPFKLTHIIASHKLSLYYLNSGSAEMSDGEICPDNTYVSFVKSKHVSRVNEVWPHRSPGSDRFFDMLTSYNLGFGLFSKRDDELLAWVYIGDMGHILHLYCEELHRRKGYAEYILKHVIDKILRQKKDVFAFILVENFRSLNLFLKLGFHKGDECVCIDVCNN